MQMLIGICIALLYVYSKEVYEVVKQSKVKCSQVNYVVITQI